jgi:hypothetical protein
LWKQQRKYLLALIVVEQDVMPNLKIIAVSGVLLSSPA